MNRRCKGGTADLKRASRLVDFCFLYLILSVPASAQISINGFCKQNSVAIGKGYNKIFVLDYNNDYKDDLLLYDNENKNITLAAGTRSGEYSEPVEKKFPHRISEIQYFDSVKGYGKIYIFTSRASRLVGICNFGKTGAQSVITTKKFDSYPQSINVADINSDGRNEALISGSAFDGLFILELKRTRLNGQSVINGRTFSNAAFIDLNYDSYRDIAACDVLKNEIIFFINRLDGTFRRTWSLAPGNKIKSLQTNDFNSDMFTDLTVLTNHGFEILFGDSVSSFTKRKPIDLEGEPLSIAFGDFNRDKSEDVAYLLKNGGKVNIIFNFLNKPAKPLPYMTGDSCRCIASIKNKKNPRLIVLSQAGNLHSIEQQTEDDADFKLTLAIKPEYVSEFDFGKNKNFSLGIIDSYDNTIKVLLGNNSGVLSRFYTYNLVAPHTKLLIDNTSDSMKIFYTYTPGEKLIEVISADFHSNKTVTNKLYSRYPIVDIKLSKNKSFSVQPLFITTKKKDGAGLMIFRCEDSKYISIYLEDIKAAYDFTGYAFDRNDYLYYWDFNEWKYALNRLTLNSRDKNIVYSIDAPSGNSQTDFKANIFSPNKYDAGNPIICFMDLLVKKIWIVYQSDINQISYVDGLNFSSGEFLVDYLSLWNGKGRYIFAYDSMAGEFYRADMTYRKNYYQFINIMTMPGVKNYFITGNYISKISVIFVNKLDNTISIRKIE